MTVESASDRRFDVRVLVGVDLLARPALGADPRRTRLGVLAICLYAALALGAIALDRAFVVHTHWLLAAAVDRLLWWLVLGATLAWVVALGYALWNGGPATALGIAVGPDLLAGATRFGLVLTTEIVVTLVAGSAVATVALVVTARRRCGGVRPTSYGRLENGLLLTTTASVVALVAYLEVLAADVPEEILAIDAVGLVFLPVAGVLAAYWAGWLGERRRTADARTRS